MAVRNFGRPNADPRAKRALAHTRIKNASGSDGDLALAKEAVRAAGDSRKSRDSGFAGALAGLALRDTYTDTIVASGNSMVADCVDERGGVTAASLDFVVGRSGVMASRIAFRRDGEFDHYSSLTVVAHGPDRHLMDDYPGTSYPIIPFDESGMCVDALAVRELPVQARVILAGLVERVALQD
jgi:hypothetical protein